MRSSRLAIPVLLATLAAPAWAQTRAAHPAAHPAARPAANGPKSIGKWDDWQGVTHQEGGQLVCYAFTRVSSSTPALPGRGDVVLTVTERLDGRDAVAITAGFAYVNNAEVQLVVDQGAALPFYTASRSAFARDGKAVVAAFDKGRLAVAKSPGPRQGLVSDTFSLRGFTAAYAAVTKACPAR